MKQNLTTFTLRSFIDKNIKKLGLSFVVLSLGFVMFYKMSNQKVKQIDYFVFNENIDMYHDFLSKNNYESLELSDINVLKASHIFSEPEEVITYHFSTNSPMTSKSYVFDEYHIIADAIKRVEKVLAVSKHKTEQSCLETKDKYINSFYNRYDDTFRNESNDNYYDKNVRVSFYCSKDFANKEYHFNTEAELIRYGDDDVVSAKMDDVNSEYKYYDRVSEYLPYQLLSYKGGSKNKSHKNKSHKNIRNIKQIRS